MNLIKAIKWERIEARRLFGGSWGRVVKIKCRPKLEEERRRLPDEPGDGLEKFGRQEDKGNEAQGSVSIGVCFAALVH